VSARGDGIVSTRLRPGCGGPLVETEQSSLMLGGHGGEKLLVTGLGQDAMGYCGRGFWAIRCSPMSAASRTTENP